jgi:hypothetical protein
MCPNSEITFPGGDSHIRASPLSPLETMTRGPALSVGNFDSVKVRRRSAETVSLYPLLAEWTTVRGLATISFRRLKPHRNYSNLSGDDNR